MPDPLAPLIAIAQRGTPFTASDGQAFVRLHAPSPGAFYILPVRSRAYREWFFHEFFAQYDTLPSSRAFHTVLNHLEAEANHHDQNQHLAVWRRVGCRGGGRVPDQILLNLANPECEFVEISPTGWKTTAGAGALLQTFRSTLPLPAPAAPSAPGALETLRSCLNLSSRADWLRCLAWLLAALRPDGPFPVLILQGPPGAGKTFAARILRSVIDPCASPLTPIPYSVRDLLTLARHNWILAFDHLSALSPQLTDALCRLSSGLGATLRETSGPGAEPLQQYYKRPVLLTVTERWSCPADLARRALTVTFPPLTPRTEARLLTVFQQAWPDILAALCSAVAAALSRMNHIDPPSGRCPDALAWAMAASPALGCTGEEMRQAFALAEPHPMAEAVRNLLEQRRHFAGSATQLLELLQPFVGCHTPKGLSQQLRSCMLTLSDTRIELKFKRLGGGARIIELSDDPCDASCEKTPPDASQTLDPPPQPTEKEELTTP
ncbi:MAG: hypothetical protein ABSG26_10280 [Bryobacteraceae bacterium]|jgi:hypothetical protein